MPNDSFIVRPNPKILVEETFEAWTAPFECILGLALTGLMQYACTIGNIEKPPLIHVNAAPPDLPVDCMQDLKSNKMGQTNKPRVKGTCFKCGGKRKHLPGCR